MNFGFDIFPRQPVYCLNFSELRAAGDSTLPERMGLNVLIIRTYEYFGNVLFLYQRETPLLREIPCTVYAYKIARANYLSESMLCPDNRSGY